VFCLGSAKQASDHETTSEHLINHIESTCDHGKDVATSLESLTPMLFSPLKPTVKTSTDANAAAKQAEDRQCEIEFKEEFAAWMKRKQVHDDDTAKACAFLWSHCAKSVQQKIEASKDCEATIKKNPIEPLKAVKQHALNCQECRCEMSIILDSIRSVANLKQKEGESLVDCAR